MHKIFIKILALLTACFLPLTCQTVAAKDTLIMKGNKKYEGIFQSLKNDRIYFQVDGGKTMNQPRTFADKLILDPPSKVTVTPRGKKKIEDMSLKGYEKSNFIFEQNGKEIIMPGMQVATMEVGMDFSRGEGGDSGESGGIKPLIIDMADLSSWMKEGNPTPEQTKAFESYKTARTTYDNFVQKSSALVKSMDKATGSAREGYLNELRKRKNDEQLILGDLKKAEKQLLTAFPEMKGANQKN